MIVTNYFFNQIIRALRYVYEAKDMRSGPGGRRFKSSLPDHSFQSLTINFWLTAYAAEGDFEAAKASKINKHNFPLCCQFNSRSR